MLNVDIKILFKAVGRYFQGFIAFISIGAMVGAAPILIAGLVNLIGANNAIIGAVALGLILSAWIIVYEYRELKRIEECKEYNKRRLGII